MDAEIIAIGTELLLGQSVDTNSSWIARNLARLGFNVFHLQFSFVSLPRMKKCHTRRSSVRLLYYPRRPRLPPASA